MKNFTIKIITLAILQLGVLSACNSQRINGDGNIVKTERSVSAVDDIVVSNALSVTIRFGDTPTIEIETDQNLMEHIYTDQNGSTLKLYTKHNLRPSKKIRIWVTMPSLERLEVNGASKVDFKNSLNADEFRLSVSGASHFNGKLEVGLLKLNSSGASKAEISGSASVVKADCSGASQIDAEAMYIENADLEASGASKISATVSEEASLNASGASKINFYGEAKIRKMNSSGASSVNVNR